VDDPEVTDYLNRPGRPPGGGQFEPGRQLLFLCIRDNTVNAFAMFGGFIGVNTGTLLTAQSESELAGVLAHEISHVMPESPGPADCPGEAELDRHHGRHGHRHSRCPLQLAGGQCCDRLGAGGSIQSQLAYSRDFEREADRAGVSDADQGGLRRARHGRLLWSHAAGRAGVREQRSGLLRSHPLTVERLSDMQNRAQNASLSTGGRQPGLSPRARQAAGADGHAARGGQRVRKQLREKKYASEAATRYGLAYSLLQAKEVAAAQREVERCWRSSCRRR
jgi:predicted Zn-dependent protease